MNDKFSENISLTLAFLYHRAWTLAEFDDEYKENPTYERRCVVQSRIFAELIVRECAAYAFSDDQDHKAMLNHFGVKE